VPAGVVEAGLFGRLYATDAMRAVFDDRARVQRWLDVEAALARVEARLGVIPSTAAEDIVAQCRVERIDLARLAAGTERAGTPILPLVRQLAALCRDGNGEFVHWGATTQDIVDTATVLQIEAGLVLIADDLAAIAARLAELAARHRDTPMAGRSYLQQAAPITFGFKLAVVLAAVERARARLAEIMPRVRVGQFAGAVGTLAALGEDGPAVQAALMAELGLGVPEIAWHAARDRIADVGCWLGVACGTIAKLACDVALLMQTDVAEASEGAADGRGASSTMPQKRNPVAATFILAGCAQVRALVPVLLEAMIADHERPTGPWQSEWAALPAAFLYASGVFAHGRALVEGLVVDPARMRANLSAGGGLLAAEAVMMGLAPLLGRQTAHQLVTAIVGRVRAGEGGFVDLLAADPTIAAHLDRSAIAALADPASHVGLAGEMVDRVLARCRARWPLAG
jgi:3-carboxy-cis,cis-muconate cycloisomerase